MKNIILTGASSGIGEATARMLVADGNRVLLMARNAGKLQALQQELGSLASVAVCDVRDYNEVYSTVQSVKEMWTGIDVLINNAGLGYFDKFDQGSIEQWSEMIDVNIKGLLNCIHACLPHLVSSSGQIINLGSVGSHHVYPNSGVYCATKHAVHAISESIRLEMPDKVRITTISPGSVNTPFIERTTNPIMLSEYRGYFAQGLQPQQVAEQVLNAINCPPGSVISEIIIRPSRVMK